MHAIARLSVKCFILLLITGSLIIDSVHAQEGGNPLSGDLRVHDPVMIKQGSRYYVFHTERGVSIKTSDDRTEWKRAGSVFSREALPAWHRELTVITPALGEGVFIIRDADYHYIFASRGICCKGLESNYQIVMGRSKDLHGPYLARDGGSWLDNRYTVFLAGEHE